MSQHHNHHHHHHHNHRDAPGGHDWAEYGEYLELEAEIFAGCIDEAVSVLAKLRPNDVRRIADVGCGPGGAATALAKAFPQADVLALDRSPELLAMANNRAQRMGVAARVTTQAGDLEALSGALRGLDLIWAGMVLHHLGELPRVLRELHDALSSGGMLAIAEFGPPTRTLPDELGFGARGFAQRHSLAVSAATEAHLPPGARKIDWPGVLRAAGFELAVEQALKIDLPAPLHQRARQWVGMALHRSVDMVAQTLSADDRATIAVLMDPKDPRGVMLRDDVTVQAGRSFFVARKR